MKTCSKCGIEKPEADFYSHGGGKLRADCKVCTNARVGLWQEANRDKFRGYVRKSCKAAYDANPEKGRKKSADRRAEKPDHVRAIVRRSNRKRRRENYVYEHARQVRNYTARRASAPKWLTPIQLAQIEEFYDVARGRSMQTGIQYHVDHIIPVRGKAVCGLHVPWNLQILTQSENCSKKNMVMEA